MGFVVSYNAYANNAEIDKAAGKVDAAVEECNNNLYYRGTAPRIRNAIVAMVKDVTGVTIKTKPALDKDKKPLVKDGQPVLVADESPDNYVSRALAVSGKTLVGLQPMVDKLLVNDKGELRFAVDITEAEGSGGGGKLAQKWIDFAARMLASGKLDSFLKQHQKLLGVAYAGSKTDTTELGRAYKAVIEATEASFA